MVSGFVVNLEILYMYYHFIFALDLDLSWKATAVFSIDKKNLNFLGKLFSRTGTWTVRENNLESAVNCQPSYRGEALSAGCSPPKHF